MRMSSFVFMAFLLSALPISAMASIPLLQQSLVEAERDSKNNSNQLKAASSSVNQSNAQASAVSAALYPNLSIQGNYFYQTDVPSLSVGPIGTLQFGTHNNYAVGPVLSYTIFDGGKNWDSSKSADFTTKSKEESLHATEKQVELNVRQAYFRVQYALRQMNVTADSLRLAQAQAHDIDLRFAAGASSKLDQVQSHRDVINYQLKYEQVQNDLANSLRALIALTGIGQNVDTSRPIPENLQGAIPEGMAEPTLQVHLDSLSESLKEFKATMQSDLALTGPSSNHPEILAYEAEISAAKKASKSESAGLFPKLSLQAKSQYDYPEVVIPQAKIQNTLMASLSFPLFEGNASHGRAAERESAAMVAEFQRDQRKVDMQRDYSEAHDFLLSLESQQALSERSMQEAQEVAKLTFQSYKAGKSRYLDVQDANLKLLESELNAAQIQSNLLSVVAVMAYLENQVGQAK